MDRTAAEAQRALALAWQLKDQCYAAWSSAPPDAVRAAQSLAALQAQCTDAPFAPPVRDEINALAAWTQAIARLIQGEMADAVVLLDTAEALFDRIARADAAAQTRVPCIMALSMLGRHDDAVACALQAQARFSALGDTRSAAKVSLNLGSLHLRHDAHAEAVHHYRQAAVLFARQADHPHSVMADIGVGDALAALGDGDEAERLYARAGMRADAHALPVLQALVDESKALLALARGRYGDALAGFENARRRYQRLEMPQQLTIAEKQLADAYLELHLLPEALALYDTALARMRALQMPDDEAWTLAQRGRAEALGHDVHAATASFEASALRFAAQHNPVGVAAVTLSRAELALAQCDAATAEALARQAQAGFAAAGLAGERLRAEVVVAEASLAAGDTASARADFARLLGASRHQAMRSAELRCLSGAGRAARAEGDVDAARAAFAAAIAHFEAQRRALPGDDVRIAFLANHLGPYEAMLELALRDLQTAGPARAAEVLRWTDRVRARTLGERLRQPRPAGGDTAAERTLRTRVQWLARRLQQQHDEGESPAELERLLHRAEGELLELARRERLAAASPRADGVGGTGTDIDTDGQADDVASALPQALQDGEAVVEYGIAGGRVFACVVTRGGITVHHALAPLNDIGRSLKGARFQIESLRHAGARLAAHAEQLVARALDHLQRLHAQLWAPLAEPLAGVNRVLVIAPAAFGGLPFCALHDGRRFIGERVELAQAPSAQWALRGLSRPARRPRRAVVVGGDDRLAHAGREIDAVADRFAGAATRLVGTAATLDALHRHAAAADVLHLACHAEFRHDNPMFSALHLPAALLTAESVETLSLGPGIVVLSACETGLAGDGDEHVGLVRAFFVAGAARVLATLWPVDDATTAAFIEPLYDALLAGRTPAAALQTAQAELRASLPHPFHWAPFVLYGGW